MKLPRLMIAAPKSGSGKTMITCALLQVLKERDEQVYACKCGPDYIDPMFHQKVIGVPSRNLDTFFTDEHMTRALLLKDRKENDIVVMEGVMGSAKIGVYCIKRLFSDMPKPMPERGPSRTIYPFRGGFVAAQFTA